MRLPSGDDRCSGKGKAGRSSRTDALPALGELLISRRGEASGVALAQTLLAGYAAAEPAERLEFLKALADRFGPDRRRVEIALEAVRQNEAPMRSRTCMPRQNPEGRS